MNPTTTPVEATTGETHRIALHITTRHGIPGITATVTCTAGPGADCRLTCPTCEDSYCPHPRSTRVDAGSCHVPPWLEGDPMAWYDGPPTDVHDGPITLHWEGDSYTWTYTPTTP